MSLLDIRVPAVLLRTDRNSFHHGTLGAVRSLGRAGVEVRVGADCADSPVRAPRYLGGVHAPPPPGASPPTSRRRCGGWPSASRVPPY